MMLIETHPDETDAELQAAADAILQSLDPSKPNWWHPYELRGSYRRDDTIFRVFYRVAGSVEIWLWKLARKTKSRRVLLLSDECDPTPL